MSNSPLKKRLFTQRNSVPALSLVNDDPNVGNIYHHPPGIGGGRSNSSVSLSISSRNSPYMTLDQQHFHEQINISTQSLDNLQIHNVPIMDPDTLHTSITPNSSNISLSSLNESTPQPSQFYMNNRTNDSRFYMNSMATLSNLNVSSNRVNLLTELKPQISDLRDPPPSIELPYGDTPSNYDSSLPISEYVRSTIATVPTKSSLLKKSGLPFALLVRPYTNLHDNQNTLPLCKDDFIIKCSRCGAYLNPYAKFTPYSNQWRCNFCKLANELPVLYNTTDIDEEAEVVNNNKLYSNRVEVKHSVVEYKLSEDLTQTNQTQLNYTFIIDVSYISIQNGLLHSAIETIKESLNRIPDYNNETRISLICVNDKLHFFRVASDKHTNKTEGPINNFTLYEICDIDEPWLPVPYDQLLIPLQECQNDIIELLDRIPKIFDIQSSCFFGLGPALKSALKLLEKRGGKIIVLGATLPNIGVGKLKDRQYTNQEVLENNSIMLTCQDSFYKDFPLLCSEAGISIDLFLTAKENYLDVATLSNLSRFTSGKTHYYPSIEVEQNKFDQIKFSNELCNSLAMDLSLDTVMKVHVSHDLKVNAFYGHFFNKSLGLYSLPVLPRDQAYLFEISLDNDFTSDMVSFQISLSVTLTSGERRIRVITLALPTTNSFSELYNKADQLAIAVYFGQQAIEKAISSSLVSARRYLENAVTEILSAYASEVINVRKRRELNTTLQISRTLELLPMLVLSFTKCIGLIDLNIADDVRANFLNKLATFVLPDLIKLIYPTVYSLHDLDISIDFPRILNNTALDWDADGIYLIDNSQRLIIWIGVDVDSELLMDLFGVNDIVDLKQGRYELPQLIHSKYNRKIRSILGKIRDIHRNNTITYQSLYIVHGNPEEIIQMKLNGDPADSYNSLKLMVANSMVEDPTFNTKSYKHFIETLHDKITN